jgi:hypothetical protein
VTADSPTVGFHRADETAVREKFSPSLTFLGLAYGAAYSPERSATTSTLSNFLLVSNESEDD